VPISEELEAHGPTLNLRDKLVDMQLIAKVAEVSE